MRKEVDRKRGALTPETMIILVLLVIFFLVVFWSILKPLFSSELHLGMKERWCQMTIAIKNSLPDPFNEKWYPICSAERLQLTKETFEKARVDEDNLQEGGIRYIFDLMRRCKFIVGGDQKGALFSDKHCYICYVVGAEDTTLFPIYAHDFYSFALLKNTDKGDSYLRNLQSSGQADLPHDIVLPGNITANHNYAVVYIDNIKPNNFILLSKPIVGCLFGFKAAGVIPVAQGYSPYVCLAGAVAGGASSLYDLFQENTNKLVFAELNDLKEHEDGDKLGCTGYEY